MKETDDFAIWSRTQGIESAPSIPLVQVEFYFPEIDDPRIIMAAINDFRGQFDLKGNEMVEELKQFRNQNTVVFHIVGKKTVVAPRDQLEKRLFFTSKKAVEGLNETEGMLEIGDGSPDDYYAWISSTPNDIKPSSEGGSIVRSERLVGFNLVDRCENLPNSRRGNRRGCYFHDFFANDVKLGAWAMRMALPFAQTAI